MGVSGLEGWFWIDIELTKSWQIGSSLSRDWKIDGLAETQWMVRLDWMMLLVRIVVGSVDGRISPRLAVYCRLVNYLSLIGQCLARWSG